MSSDNDTNPSGVATNEGEESLLAPSLNEDSGLDLILNPDLLSVPSNSQSAFSSGNTSPDTEMLLTVRTRSASGSSDVTPGAKCSFSVSSLLIPASVSSAITDSQSSLSSTSSVFRSRDKSAEDGGVRQIKTGSSDRSDVVPSPFGSSGTIEEIELPIIFDPQSRPIGSSGTIRTSEMSMINDTPETISSSEISITDPQTRQFGSSGTIPSSEINITDPQSRPLGSFGTIPAIDLPMNIDSQSSLTSTSGSTTLSTSSSAESRDTSSLNLTGGSSDTPEGTTKDDWYRTMRARAPRIRVSGDGTIGETEFAQTSTGGTSSTTEPDKFLSVPGDICESIYFGRVSPLNEEARQDENKSEQNKDVDDSGTNQADENRDKDA